MCILYYTLYWVGGGLFPGLRPACFCRRAVRAARSGSGGLFAVLLGNNAQPVDQAGVMR
jgi:hypothetical protein